MNVFSSIRLYFNINQLQTKQNNALYNNNIILLKAQIFMLNYINLIIYECYFNTYSLSIRIETMYVYSIYQDYVIPIRAKMLYLLQTYLRKIKKLNGFYQTLYKTMKNIIR